MTALDDLDAAVLAVKQQDADQQAALAAANTALAAAQAQAALDSVTIATLTQELADCQSKPAPVSGAAPHVGLYLSGGREADLEGAEATGGMAKGHLSPTWFFFSTIPAAANAHTAITNNVKPLTDAGRDVIVNLSTAGVTWGSVARGDKDADIQAFCHELGLLGKPLRFVFNNEPDQSAWHAPNFERGTAQDYDLCVRRIRQWLPPTTRVGFCCAEASRFPQWLVTPWLYDFFSIDGDNRGTGSAWMTPQQILDRDLPYMPQNGREVLLTSGTVQDPSDPNRQAQWYASLADIRGIANWCVWGGTGFAPNQAALEALASV